MQTAAQSDDYVAQAADKLTIEEIAFEAGELPVLPQVILKLVELTNNPKVRPETVEHMIETDQGATARVLTLANSPYYGLPRRISCVREAVVILGYKSVNNLASQITVFNTFLGKGDSVSLARRDLWKHSLYTGQCSKIICTWLNSNDQLIVDPEEAFTAALLHDMGKLALLSVLPEDYAAAQIASRTSGMRFHDTERDFLPYTHAVVGNAMAERWSLPDTLCDAVLNHHSPLDSQTKPELVAVVTLADEIALGLHESTAPRAALETASECVTDAAAILQFSPNVLRGITNACRLEMSKGISLSSYD